MDTIPDFYRGLIMSIISLVFGIGIGWIIWGSEKYWNKWIDDVFGHRIEKRKEKYYCISCGQEIILNYSYCEKCMDRSAHGG